MIFEDKISIFANERSEKGTGDKNWSTIFPWVAFSAASDAFFTQSQSQLSPFVTHMDE